MYNLCVRNKHAYESGFSSIAATAALSAVVLLSVLAWQTNAILSAKNKALHVVSEYSPSAIAATVAGPAEAAQTESAAADPYDL